jgi:hypothetical protein
LFKLSQRRAMHPNKGGVSLYSLQSFENIFSAFYPGPGLWVKGGGQSQ